MRLPHPLNEIFRNRTRVRVLRALYELPQGIAVSAREMARRAGVSHPSASAALRALRDEGIVHLQRAPRADLFTLNAAHITRKRLADLFEWERELSNEVASFLKSEIESRLPFVSAAILFGSFVWGSMRATSDIDLALICPAEKTALVENGLETIAARFRDRFGNRLNTIITTSPVAQLRKSRRADHRLWGRILREGVPLFGLSEATKTGS